MSGLSGLTIALGIVFIVIAIAIVVLIICQQSSSYGLGAMSGNSDFGSYAAKGRTKDSILTKITIVLAIILGILTVVLNIVS